MARPRRRSPAPNAREDAPPPAARAPRAAPAPPARVALALFALAAALRLLFWGATADRSGAFHAAYEGDALLWLDWARAIRLGLPFELDFPLHPPGTSYLLAALWNGEPGGIPGLRALWCLLGAAAVALFYLAARRSFGARPALAVGLLLAGAHGLLVLSASIDSETPYLVLVAASLLLHEDLLAARPARGRVALWGLLQGAACLFRVEHALFAVLGWAWLALARRRRGEPVRSLVAPTALALAMALAALAPWHLRAWRAVARLNAEPPRETAGEAAAYGAIERGTAHLPWDDAARRWRAALPAFARRPAALFVAATAAHRGHAAIGAAEVAAVEEAFGASPRPLPGRFFVSLYGPLNFALANHAEASGGFSTRVLERPPPLAGGAASYPHELVSGLPPPELALTYPPHLALVLDGYAVGGRWIAGHPAQFARLAARKLALFWSGAASGLTGWNLPAGPATVRRFVDMSAPRPGPRATLWQLAVLALAAAGAWRARRSAALAPWLLYLASKAIVTVAFFGYVRQGALGIPVVALLAVLAFVPGAPVAAALQGAATLHADASPLSKPSAKGTHDS